MSSIASLSAKVREKDAEKSKILNDVKDLEGLKSQNIVGQLLFVVQTVGNVQAEYTTDLKVEPSECNLSVTKLTKLSLGKEIELQLTSKNISIEITCKKDEKEYVTTFDLTEVPDNNTLATQLDAVPTPAAEEGEEAAAIPVHVKATYDTIDGLIESKQLEIKQVEIELQKIAEELKKATTQTVAATKTKKTKATQQKKKQPKQQQQQQEEATDFDGEEMGGDGDGSGSGVVATIANSVVLGIQMLFTHRAVLLFGAAAFAIYTNGEMASV